MKHELFPIEERIAVNPLSAIPLQCILDWPLHAAIWDW